MTELPAHKEDLGSTFRIDLPLLLPEVGDAQDGCVARLVSLLESRDGVSRVHVVRAGRAFPDDVLTAQRRIEAPDAAQLQVEPQLCLHYNPARLSLARLTGLIHDAGTELRDAYSHARFAFPAVGSEDDSRRIEDRLRSLPGVTAASVSLPAGVARVEFARKQISRDEIERHLRLLGLDLPIRTLAQDDPPPEEVAKTVKREAVAPWHKRHVEIIRSSAVGVFLLLARYATPTGSLAQFALYVVSYSLGVRDNIGRFLKDLPRARSHFNLDLLIIVATAAAAALGEWFYGALLLFLFSFGHALMPSALRRANKTSSRISADGAVAKGTSTTNKAPITGESVPPPKTAGDQ